MTDPDSSDRSHEPCTPLPGASHRLDPERRQVMVYTRDGVSESYLKECWRYRSIVRFLARRDLVIRYRRTLIGVAWVLLKPVLSMGIFTVIFSRIAHMPSQGTPYPLLVLCGMLPWQLFSGIINEASISLANNPNMVTKVWLPRILLPTSPVILNSVDVLVNGMLLALVLAWYHIMPPIQILLAPVILGLVVLLALGIGYITAMLMVYYHDIKNIIPVALQFGILCSPVAFTLAQAPTQWSRWLWLNPLALPIEWLRWCILPGFPPPSFPHIAWSVIEIFVILALGIWYFRYKEGLIADVI